MSKSGADQRAEAGRTFYLLAGVAVGASGGAHVDAGIIPPPLLSARCGRRWDDPPARREGFLRSLAYLAERASLPGRMRTVDVPLPITFPPSCAVAMLAAEMGVLHVQLHPHGRVEF